jgi:alpha-aminoadipate carrier protein LysW
MAYCPECEAAIDVEEDDVEEGQTLDCPECGAELEVVNTNPLELDVVSEEEEEDDSENGSW